MKSMLLTTAASCLLAAGCGFIHAPSTSLPGSFTNAPPAKVNRVPEDGVLVVISYPAAVHPDIRGGIARRYAQAKIGSMVSSETWPDAFDHMLAKTTFYVRDFYKELSKVLPPGQVVLQPAELIRDNNARLSYRMAGMEMPAVLRVDFMAYNGPTIMEDNGEPVDGQTFGKTISPILFVTTDPAASPATQGALAGLDRLPALPSDGMQPAILAQIVAKAEAAAGTAVPKSTTRPAKLGTYTALPLLDLEMDTKAWDSYLLEGSSSLSPAAPLMRPLAMVVLDYLSQIDFQVAAKRCSDAYFALYDPQAALLPADSPRRTLLRRFMKAEAEFLYRQNDAFIDRLVAGDYGRSMRARITSEREMNDKINAAGNKLALGALLGGLAGFYAGGPIVTPATNQLASSTFANMKSMSDAHFSSMAQVAEQQVTVSGTAQTASQAIQARSIEELREKFREIYRRSGF